ncbi:3'-5' exonuclease [Desulfovibrio inopinatus]|uniref:3'-5' exonuclease n=1 Tax=Desulfovibrio inopinatus TaxID=102109 RepID=UPI0004083956|nr:3'-5' exonuclease [Desulfovibrio inopinatus]
MHFQNLIDAEQLEELQRQVTKDEINTLPLRRYEGRVEYVLSQEHADRAADVLEPQAVLGFDTETRPSFKKGRSYPPAILQLAGVNVVYLFRLKALRYPNRIWALLERPDVVKTGVAVRDDITGLGRIHPLDAQAFVDLGEVARHWGLKTSGLRTLAANLLRIRISKKAQCSNWSKVNLTRQQIDYAATDAWVSLQLHQAMKGLQLL